MNTLQHALADSGAEPRSVLERWSAGELLQPKRAGSHRIGRRFLVWLGGILAVLLGLSLLGAGYESVAEAADARAYPDRSAGRRGRLSASHQLRWHGQPHRGDRGGWAIGPRHGAVGCSQGRPRPHGSAPTIARAWATASRVHCRALPSASLKSCTRCCSARYPGRTCWSGTPRAA